MEKTKEMKQEQVDSSLEELNIEEPNAETKEAIKEVEEGLVEKAESVEEILEEKEEEIEAGAEDLEEELESKADELEARFEEFKSEASAQFESIKSDIEEIDGKEVRDGVVNALGKGLGAISRFAKDVVDSAKKHSE